MALSCYDNIVGLSQTSCPCAIPISNGGDVSRSGLYLDELAPLDQMRSLYGDCAKGSPWDILANARDAAILQFVADSNAMLASRHEARRGQFSGTIGEISGTSSLSISEGYAGIRIAAAPVRGGSLTIKSIGGIFTSTGTVLVRCFDLLGNEYGTGTEIQTIAGRHVAVPVSLILPLAIPYTSKTEYFFVYEVSQGNMPRGNNLTCGCGGFNPSLNYNSPTWNQEEIGSRAWANWVMVGGWKGNNLESFDKCATSSPTVLNGLTLEIGLSCDISEILCSGAALDFAQNPVALSMAFAVQYKAAEIAATAILRQSNLDRLNVINREALTAGIREWRVKYSEMINYIISVTPTTGNDCLKCKSKFSMKISNIFT